MKLLAHRNRRSILLLKATMILVLSEDMQLLEPADLLSHLVLLHLHSCRLNMLDRLRPPPVPPHVQAPPIPPHGYPPPPVPPHGHRPPQIHRAVHYPPPPRRLPSPGAFRPLQRQARSFGRPRP